MAKNSVICKVVAKECHQLAQGGCQPSIQALSACVKRLGSQDEIQYAFDAWMAARHGSGGIKRAS